ncbi:hypothetical protein PANT_8d00003 [Moesziomyces antarcticus T-34]|uniref:Uncharacterized protein n=1 Tax=Pseudozyma antarctica (strain T-34) TaxID=1151754 RepID=M9LUK0_PSEA3|nr:hypothetical protein PANT_8d00003 [Moesziomyces antarcticus T-34]
MVFRSLCILGLASLFASALPDDPMGRFATDDSKVGQYCNVNTAPQGENFVCFRYNSDIRAHMSSTDSSVHGYVNAAGTKSFSTDRTDVVISPSSPCPEVSTLDSGGETREFQGCPWTEPILIY